MRRATEDQPLSDREAITDILHRYAIALDTRDGELLRSVFADRLDADWTALYPEMGLVTDAPPEDFVANAMQGLPTYRATQHLLTPCQFAIHDASAEVTAYMQSTHVKFDGELWVVGGYYSLQLVKNAPGWKIRKWKLTPVWETGEP